MATTYEGAWVEIDTVLDDGESVEGYVDLGGRFHPESPEEFNHLDRLTAEELEARVAFEEWETIHLEELGELEEDAQWDENFKELAERMWPRLPISSC